MNALLELARSENVFVVVCSCCQAVLRTKPTEGAEPGISHTICPACYPGEMARMRAFFAEQPVTVTSHGGNDRGAGFQIPAQR